MSRSRLALTPVVAGLVAALALAACGGSDDAGDGATGDAADDPTTETVDDAGSGAIDDADLVTPGVLTIATGEPAYYPWVIDDDPESGQGFEAAVAYAVAEELGFGPDDVVWVRTGFEEAIAPGPKSFDVNLQQFSITDERREAVDFSSAYYATAQVVVATASSPAAGATSLADLQDLLIGAAIGTTSFRSIEEVIEPTQQAQAFNTNDDAKLALENGQVDAIVLDLPTAFYVSAVELSDGVLVGQLEPIPGAEADELGFVLAHGSPLTDAVSAAVDALRERGVLDEIATEWLGGEDEAPLLQ